MVINADADNSQKTGCMSMFIVIASLSAILDLGLVTVSTLSVVADKYPPPFVEQFHGQVGMILPQAIPFTNALRKPRVWTLSSASILEAVPNDPVLSGEPHRLYITAIVRAVSQHLGVRRCAHDLLVH
jgi:hypothetical protein